jgi:hypothetical protein
MRGATVVEDQPFDRNHAHLQWPDCSTMIRHYDVAITAGLSCQLFLVGAIKATA